MSENKQLFDEMFKKNNPIAPNTMDEIICIIDRSGSMGKIRADAEGGLNQFITEQKKIETGANLTIVEFDDRIKVVTDQVNIDEVSDYTLAPRGRTALLDAIGTVVGDAEKYKTDGKVIVVVVTDGGENCSKDWTRESIFETITERKDQGWEFVFLAANQDAISTATGYGFDVSGAMSFANSGDGVATAYAATANYTSDLRTMSKDAAVANKTQFVQSHADVLSETGAVEEGEKV